VFGLEYMHSIVVILSCGLLGPMVMDANVKSFVPYCCGFTPHLGDFASFAGITLGRSNTVGLLVPKIIHKQASQVYLHNHHHRVDVTLN
jgi:hypothetical protein